MYLYVLYYIVGVDVLGDPKECKANGTPGRSSPTNKGGSICKEPRRPIYILDVLWYNYFGSYLLDKLEFGAQIFIAEKG